MSTRSSDALKAEIAELEAMLSEMPTRRVIERIGLQHRLETARTELQHLPLDGKRLGLTFRGEPVEGSRSIVALFAGRALTAFSDAVATVAASLEHHLNGTGPLPGDNRFCVIEIYDFFKQRQAPSEVEEVEVIRVVLLE